MIDKTPHEDRVHRQPLPLTSLQAGQLHLVEAPRNPTPQDRNAFVVEPIRHAVANGYPVLYVDWARRSQRWGDVLAAVDNSPLLATLRRREQSGNSFHADPLDEPLGVKVLHAVSRHLSANDTCIVILDATQPPAAQRDWEKCDTIQDQSTRLEMLLPKLSLHDWAAGYEDHRIVLIYPAGTRPAPHNPSPQNRTKARLRAQQR